MGKQFFGITITPELLLKMSLLAFTFGVMYSKIDNIEQRLVRIERFIDREVGR